MCGFLDSTRKWGNLLGPLGIHTATTLALQLHSLVYVHVYTCSSSRHIHCIVCVHPSIGFENGTSILRLSLCVYMGFTLCVCAGAYLPWFTGCTSTPFHRWRCGYVHAQYHITRVVAPSACREQDAKSSSFYSVEPRLKYWLE